MLKVAKALLNLRTLKEIESFLLDILTPGEVNVIEMRWQIANLLMEDKLSYLEIANKVGTSTTTVTRVNRFLQQGHNGYKLALKKERHHS
jgi:TrpR-related protein YerC/YecD